ncbi:TlpA disulfide reductase family protein [Engelhardtia mirabilis]|uniref:Thiol:disulfide interchange protein DsbE n=1 Tax=Engelhardtia mirabilis TaxID=2528011 RepID=A0A518BRR6_9BACT|nr:Thiol:disulfide interchange protein DsbE [Planctomycetes bacterium Pla133]QDV03993.1 Thiol:disulfide interchange protein DsbE [Planctomycetes bacterium Pla86]
MRPLALLSILTMFVAAAPAAAARQDEPERWRCTLDLGDEELPFELAIEGERAFIVNGSERIPVVEFERTAERLALGFPHFDSSIEATRRADGSFEGTWRKHRRGDDVAQVPFRATPGLPWRFEPRGGIGPAPDRVAGRWRVDFESDDADAVGLFEPTGDGLDVSGTFLTRTGDYRYLAGEFAASTLRLSCFDGAHAFLFVATLEGSGKLSGHFRSGNWWREAWTAVRDDDVALPDAFGELDLLESGSVDEVLVLTPDGTEHTLGALAAPADRPVPRATLVQILGTWCPNCLDETEYLKQLHARYADRGLSIVGLCFELSGDAARDRAQIARYREVRGVPYPMALAGEADKPAAAAALGLVDRVLSFPTTLFVDGRGLVTRVHSGFSGPATGEAHAHLREEFEGTIEDLLAAEPTQDATWAELTSEDWFDWSAFAGATWTFRDAADGVREVHEDVHGSGVPTIREEVHPVRLAGSTVFIGEEPWILDRRARVLRRAGQPLRRLSRDSIAPLVLEDSTEPAELFGLLEHESALKRREALVAIGYMARYRSDVTLPDLAPFITAEDPAVRRVAAAIAGAARQGASLEALAAALDAADPRLRAIAAHSLALMGELPDAYTQRLARAVATDPFPSVRGE